MASSVPKFGDWNQNGAESADGYTMVFEKVRTEKKNTGPNATPERPARADPGPVPKKESQGCSCFGLFKK